jgi:hypothetical protein
VRRPTSSHTMFILRSFLSNTSKLRRNSHTTYFTGPKPKLLPQYQPNHTGMQLYSTLDRFIPSNYEPWHYHLPILTSHSRIVWRPYRNSIPLHLIPPFLLLLLLSSQLYLRSFLLKRSRFSSPFQSSEPIATNCNQPDYNASEWIVYSSL